MNNKYWFTNLFISHWQALLDLFTKKPALVPKPVEPTPAPINEVPTFSMRERLYEVAKGALGTDASPNDVAPDEYGCSETINAIYKKAFEKPICLPGILTTQLYYEMLKDIKRFKVVGEPLPGCIVISPTGLGNGSLRNGHVGIVGRFGILSNDSNTGLFKENFDLKSWRERYVVKGGFPMVYIMPI